MNLESVLIDNGLSQKEAKIYLVLLELKESLPSAIARQAEIKRPTAYVILEELKKKGLISFFKKNGVIYYRALDPQSFIEQKYNQYKTLEKSLPELISLHTRHFIIPQMTIYEGKDGLIKIMEDTLKTKTDILVWADAELATETVLADYYPTYIKKKVQKEIFAKAILGDDPRARLFKQSEKEELREVRLIPKDLFPFKNEINIYDDKVAILSHRDKVGIIIENKNIADTQRSIFQIGWAYTKTLES